MLSIRLSFIRRFGGNAGLAESAAGVLVPPCPGKPVQAGQAGGNEQPRRHRCQPGGQALRGRASEWGMSDRAAVSRISSPLREGNRIRPVQLAVCPGHGARPGLP